MVVSPMPSDFLLSWLQPALQWLFAVGAGLPVPLQSGLGKARPKLM